MSQATETHWDFSNSHGMVMRSKAEQKLAALRAENARQAAAIAAKDAALRGLMHADGCYCDAAFAGPGQHPRHTDECEAARAALSTPTAGWLSPEEAEALRAKAAEQGKTACELFDHLKASQKEVVKLREELATAREDSADLDWLCAHGWCAMSEDLHMVDLDRTAIRAARNAGGAAKCKRCEGTGKVALSREPCSTDEITCPNCKGSGNEGGAA